MDISATVPLGTYGRLWICILVLFISGTYYWYLLVLAIWYLLLVLIVSYRGQPPPFPDFTVASYDEYINSADPSSAVMEQYILLTKSERSW